MDGYDVIMGVVGAKRGKGEARYNLACENIRFFTLFAAEDVSSPGAKIEEKRIFSPASYNQCTN